MTDLRTAAQQALEALEADCGGRCNAEYNPCWQREVAETLRAALAEPVQTPHMYPLQSERMRIDPVTGDVSIGTPSAEPVQEPVAWFHTDFGSLELSRVQRVGWKPLYTAPPRRKPLTEWQINDLMANIDPEDVDSWSFRQGVYATEKHHGVRP